MALATGFRRPSLDYDQYLYNDRNDNSIVGIIYSFEGIDSDSDGYLYPDGSAVREDDEEWISDCIASAMENYGNLE